MREIQSMVTKTISRSWLFLLLLAISCQESHKNLPDCALCEDTAAEWIQVAEELPDEDSLFYLTHPAPLFRKEFSLAEKIDSARLFITAAGYYRASLNGEPIGKNLLDPAWTDYSKRIYYTAYDVTSQLTEGDNCLGVSLGNGFYNPLPLRKWGRRNPRVDLNVGKPTFIARLVLYHSDGQTTEVVTDDSWSYAYGPLQKNSVYIGVLYDQGKELPGWDTPNYSADSWQAVQLGSGPGGALQPAFFPPVKKMQEIQPISVSTLPDGKHLVDMGVNFTGTYRIRIPASASDTLTFRFGERVYEDGSLNPMTTVVGQIKREGIGGPGAPAIAWQTDSYVPAGKEAYFTPDFVYRTYRYMEISGLEQTPSLNDIQGWFTYSDVPDRNDFSSSSPLLNEIQEATKRTFLSNLVSVQSDCAVREKFGYGGDLNATSESFMYNFDMQDFYRKTVYDWVDAMNDSTFVDTAPFAGIQYCGISWESAYLITQYYLYLYYNDVDLIEERYEQNLKWMEKVARIHPEGLVDSGLSDHESLDPVPVQLTGTAHYLQCARIMTTFASVMEDAANEERFRQLAERLQGLLRSEFWEQAVDGPINRQTLFSTLLYHGIVPESELGAARDSLRMAIRQAPAGHFTTGIFGTKYILETLSEHASVDEVFAIVNSRQYPGWGHMIDRGATTIWETWKESDNSFTNCHPMFGSVTEWFYRWLGGIRPDPSYPGFGEFVLAPRVPRDLNFVRSTYHSPHGEIVSHWKKGTEGTITYEMKVPQGSRARVSIAVLPSQKLVVEKHPEGFQPEGMDGLASGNFILEEGAYTLRVSN